MVGQAQSTDGHSQVKQVEKIVKVLVVRYVEKIIDIPVARLVVKGIESKFEDLERRALALENVTSAGIRQDEEEKKKRKQQT
eukprot:11563727-Karenia_brevis.AAC.1